MPRRRWPLKISPGSVFYDSQLLKNKDLAIVLLKCVWLNFFALCFCSGICGKRYHLKNLFQSCSDPSPTQSKLTRGVGTSIIAEMVPFFTQPETVKNPRINSDWMGEGLEKLWNMFCGWYLISQIPDPEKHKKNGYITWTRLDCLGHTWTQNWTNLDSLRGYSPGAACHYMKVLRYIQIKDMCWSLAAYMCLTLFRSPPAKLWMRCTSTAPVVEQTLGEMTSRNMPAKLFLGFS